MYCLAFKRFPHNAATHALLIDSLLLSPRPVPPQTFTNVSVIPDGNFSDKGLMKIYSVLSTLAKREDLSGDMFGALNFWIPKIERTMQGDCEVNELLEKKRV